MQESIKGGKAIVNSKHFAKAHLGLDNNYQPISVSFHKVRTNQKPENPALSLAKSDLLASFGLAIVTEYRWTNVDFTVVTCKAQPMNVLLNIVIFCPRKSFFWRTNVYYESSFKIQQMGSNGVKQTYWDALSKIIWVTIC